MDAIEKIRKYLGKMKAEKFEEKCLIIQIFRDADFINDEDAIRLIAYHKILQTRNKYFD